MKPIEVICKLICLLTDHRTGTDVMHYIIEYDISHFEGYIVQLSKWS